MSYKERVVTTQGFSLLGTEADDGIAMVFDLEANKTIRGEYDGSKVLIPFHAVEGVVKTTSSEDRDDRNPYYCGTADNSKGGIVGDAKVCVDCVGE